MIEVGNAYNISELSKALGIDRKTFSRNKDRILLEMTEAYDYQTTYTASGRISKIIIKDKHYDYKYEAMNKKKKAEKDKLYEEIIPEIIREQPLNTPANISRVVQAHYHEITNITKSEYTIYSDCLHKTHKWYGKNEYDKPEFEEEMNIRKGRIINRVWAIKKNELEYEPLTEEQTKELKALFKQFVYESKEGQKEEEFILAEYDNGNISKEECKSRLGDLRFNSFDMAKKEFQKKYGGYPIYVNEYEDYGT